MFNKIDKNRDDSLTQRELAEVLELYHGKEVDTKTVHNLFKKVDKDKSGHIDFNEFWEAFSHLD